MSILRKYYKIIIFIIITVVFISTNQYLTYLAILATINAIAVLGINIISGYTGQLHLGQAAFMGIGAYTAALLSMKLGLSFWIGLIFAIILSSLFGALLGIPALNLKGGPYLALVTQTFGEIIYLLITNLVFLTGGPFGLLGIERPKIGPVTISGLQPYFIFCLVFLGISFYAAWQIIHSRFGRVFVAIRESEDAADAMGVNTKKYKIMAFSIAAAFGGIAGALYGPFMSFLSPEQFRWMPSILLISMAIVGGLRSLVGGVIGAYVITWLPELLRVAEDFRMILYGILVILTLAFLPDGLISLWGKRFSEIKVLFKTRIENIKRSGTLRINT